MVDLVCDWLPSGISSQGWGNGGGSQDNVSALNMCGPMNLVNLGIMLSATSTESEWDWDSEGGQGVHGSE